MQISYFIVDCIAAVGREVPGIIPAGEYSGIVASPDIACQGVPDNQSPGFIHIAQSGKDLLEKCQTGFFCAKGFG